MKTKSVYPIRYVAHKTGLTTHIIRVWEKRYQTVIPRRTDSNRRIYTEDDIRRLNLLREAVTAGNSISQIAKLGTEELSRLLKLDLSEGPTHLAARKQKSDPRVLLVKRSLDAVINLDMTELESILDQAAVHLTKSELIQDVIVPLCKKIGTSWRQGELKIVNEHMATTIIRAFLWNLLRSVEISPASPKIIIATPTGHRHDLGALTIGLVASESGWESLYFGPSLPAEEIAAAAVYTNAQAVALSVTYHTDNHRLISEVKKLRRYLNTDTALLLGGQGARTIADLLKATDIRILKDINHFKKELDTLLDTHLSESKSIASEKNR